MLDNDKLQNSCLVGRQAKHKINPMVRLRPFDSLRSLRAVLSVVEGRSPLVLSKVEVPKFKWQISKQKFCHLVFVLCAYFGFCILSFGITDAYALNLDNLKIYFLSGDYKAAISEGEKVLTRDKTSSDLEELYYILGLSYLKDGNYLRASDIFEIILKELKNASFKDEAKLGLADSYFLRADYDKARIYYKELAAASGAAKLKAIAYQRLSQCAFKQGDSQEGKEYLDKLHKEYPLNFEVRLSKDISAPSDFYTVQVGSFSSPVNSQNLCSRLLKNGYDAYVEETETEDRKTYRVRVGKLSFRDEAVKLENKLSQEGYPTKIFP